MFNRRPSTNSTNAEEHQEEENEDGDDGVSQNASRKPLTRCSIGFGSGTTGAFGANKPGFGAPAATGGTSLFGGNTANAGTSSGFGGFGGSTNTASTGFGSNTGGGLFGANKTGFGATNTTTASPFGGAATNTTGFGASSGFGASAATLGGNVGNPEGTANPAFQPTTEKEPNTTTSNNYQSITVMPAYVKYSFEELRLADYAHGRQKANAGGTAGAFGQSTGFGGFSGAQPAASGFGGGTAGGSGLFGSTNTSSPFGTNTASTGFGRNTATSGGLFGAKPATGAFGGAPSTQTGGLFGSTPSTGFGANTGTTGFGASTTPSIFNTSATQNKPGGLFGSTPGTSTTPFGSTAGTTGFGSNTGTSGGLFGNTQAQQPAANPFGTAATQPASNPFGGFGSNAAPTSSIFGNAAAKPATGGLFGSTGTTTGGGLFGAQPAQNTTSAFGNAGAASTTGGLFAPKPATGGLFGSTPAATTNTGGGLFGGSTFGQNAPQQPQNTGGGLFGGLNQAKPSLFGGATGATGGPSLFGNAGAQQTSGPSLFGNIGQNQQQQQNQQAGSSLFGGGINTSQQYQQPQQTSFTTSINDLTAFGTSSMFSNLATPDISNPGPIATPLSSLSKQKKSAVLPMYKMNPASASTSRYATPQKRGFGFTYSTYGTPTSAATTPGTPGTFNASLLGGSLSQKLMKSVSTSSLRNSYNSSFNREDSILAPGAFSNSPGSRFNSTGSMKRLVINRGIRQDLFTPPTKDKEAGGTLKKRVSFDSSTVGGMNGAPNGTSSPLKQMQSTETVTSNGKEGFNRSSNRSTNGIGSQSNGAFASPEMEQVKNNQLSILPEGDEENFGPRKSDEIKTKDDQEPGDYWSIPSKEELRAMTPAQLKKVENFIVGRYGVGQVAFNAPVDITTVKNLDDLYGKVVELELRSATVYPNWMVSPEPGTALNVPSTITLENSWPRAARGRKVTPKDLEKHIVRLKRMKDTQFISYDNDTGLVKFTVEHFTTYEVEFSDEETDADGEVEPNFGESTLSAPPDTPTPKSRTPLRQEADQSFASTSEYTESDPEEDTFDFKKRKTFPGAFDHTSAIDDDAEMEDEYVNQQQSFLDNRSAGSLSDNVLGDSIDQDDVQGNELVRVESNEMAGSYPQPDDTVEPENDSQDFEEDVAAPTPGGLMRARLRAMQNSDSPLKQTLQVEQDDWADMLQRTVSPQKRDREQLKRMRDSVADGTGLDSPSKKLAPANRGRIVSDGRGFATSIDLMHSLFGESKSPMKMAPIPEKRSGFEVGLLSCNQH
jgi:nuclear pore complex protein Nup98-Nup96